MTTYSIGTSVTGLKYSAKLTEISTANAGCVFVKNSVIAYKLTSSAFTEITDVDYPSRHTYSVTLTSVTTTATATTSIPHSLVTGDSVIIAGASPAAYNGTYTITVTGASTFTYTFAGGTSPATGTITAVGGRTTVPGVVYLDGYIFVQDINGPILNSSVDDVTTWNILSTISPEKEPSNAVAIAKSLNFLVAFKQWDTEFFYDAGVAAPASPLAVVESSYLKLGCATADSVVEFDGGIVFMSRRDNLQRSREIHVLNGLTPKKISDANVERILNGDDLATVYSLYLSTAGHQFYLLTLKTSLITIAYNFSNGIWSQLSFLTAQSPQTLTTLTQTGGTATATKTAHGFSDGDPVTIAGANQSGYNGIQNITYVDANTFTYPVDSATVSPATGTVTATGYNESYFPAVAYATYQNLDLILHETNGIIYSLEPTTYQDNGVPINMMLRLQNWDGGNNEHKMIARFRAIGDRVAATLLVRYSDDDYVTNSTYRRLDMNAQSAQLTRLGSTRRRAYEMRHTENTALRLEAIEQDLKQGK